MDPELLARARRALAEASVLAEAPGVSYIPSGRHAHESRDPTTSTGMAAFDYVAMVLRDGGGRGPRSFRDAVEKAERAVVAARKARPARLLTPKQIVLSQLEGESAAKAGEIVGVHRTTVWRWRTAAGRSGETGEELVGGQSRSWLTIGSADEAA
jgi:hypothetical protein